MAFIINEYYTFKNLYGDIDYDKYDNTIVQYIYSGFLYHRVVAKDGHMLLASAEELCPAILGPTMQDFDEVYDNA